MVPHSARVLNARQISLGATPIITGHYLEGRGRGVIKFTDTNTSDARGALRGRAAPFSGNSTPSYRRRGLSAKVLRTRPFRSEQKHFFFFQFYDSSESVGTMVCFFFFSVCIHAVSTRKNAKKKKNCPTRHFEKKFGRLQVFESFINETIKLVSKIVGYAIEDIFSKLIN